MPSNDQPRRPPSEMGRDDAEESEAEEEVSDTETDTDSDFSGFDIRENEEIPEFVTEALIREQDHFDRITALAEENRALEEQWAKDVEEFRDANERLRLVKEACKRRADEQDEWLRLKRLRLSEQEAMLALEEPPEGWEIYMVETTPEPMDATGGGGVVAGGAGQDDDHAAGPSSDAADAEALRQLNERAIAAIAAAKEQLAKYQQMAL